VAEAHATSQGSSLLAQCCSECRSGSCEDFSHLTGSRYFSDGSMAKLAVERDDCLEAVPESSLVI